MANDEFDQDWDLGRMRWMPYQLLVCVTVNHDDKFVY